MDIQIIPFEPSHAGQVVDLSLRAWAPVFDKMRPATPDFVYEAFYPQGWRARQAADIEAILHDPSTEIWVAAEAGRVLGWVGARLHPEDSMGEIHILAVDPDHQRRGLAKALMDRATTQMRQAGMSIVMVETGDDPGHAPSRATYESAGFQRWPVARYFRRL